MHLKIPHFFSEKNSISEKFDLFVSQLKVPGKHTFESAKVFPYLLFFWLACTPIGNAQPLTSWKVPANFGPGQWHANFIQGIILLSSAHSNWLYAYAPQGGIVWKRPLNWPLTYPPQKIQGYLLIQQEGQPAALIKPETGEFRQQLHRDFSGWIVSKDSNSWFRLGPDGSLQIGNADWSTWKPWVQLRLERGDRWLGPPVLAGNNLYLGSNRGEAQRLEFPSGKTQRLPPLKNPLLPPQAYRDGVVRVSLNGLLMAHHSQGSWLGRFSGGEQCYHSSGLLLARPCQDQAGNLYMATRHRLHCWNPQGKELWRKDLACASPILWLQQACYVADSSPALLRLNPHTGETLQRWPLSDLPCAELTGENGFLAILLSSGQLQLMQLPGQEP